MTFFNSWIRISIDQFTINDLVVVDSEQQFWIWWERHSSSISHPNMNMRMSLCVNRQLIVCILNRRKYYTASCLIPDNNHLFFSHTITGICRSIASRGEDGCGRENEAAERNKLRMRRDSVVEAEQRIIVDWFPSPQLLRSVYDYDEDPIDSGEALT